MMSTRYHAIDVQPVSPFSVARRPLPAYQDAAQPDNKVPISGITPEIMADGDHESMDKKSDHIVGKQPSSRSRLQTFSIIGLLIAILGTIFPLAALGLLTFLWIRSPGLSDDLPPKSWDNIVLSGWLTRSISLSTVVIRLALAFQGSFCTALISAMLLERKGVPLKEVPRVLVLRSSWSGAHHLLYGMASRKSVIFTVLAVILLSMNILSQFSSTLLLSDLQNGFITNTTNLTGVPIAISMNNTDNSPHQVSVLQGMNPWMSAMLTYPSFAEWSSGLSEQVKDNIDDTGDMIRAYLPFHDANSRAAIREYDGYAMATELRFVCTAPNVTSAKLLSYAEYKTTSASAPLYIEYTTSIPGIVTYHDGEAQTRSNTSIGAVFCNIATKDSRFGYSNNNTESVITSCRPVSNFNYIGSLLHSDEKIKALQYAVFTSNGTLDDWNDSVNKNRTMAIGGQNGVWSRVSVTDSAAYIDLTICYSNFGGAQDGGGSSDGVGGAIMKASLIHGHQGVSERSLSWDARNQRYNTSSMLQLLAGHQLSTRLSLADRRVLSLTPPGPNEPWNSTFRKDPKGKSYSIPGSQASDLVNTVTLISQKLADSSSAVGVLQSVSLPLCQYCYISGLVQQASSAVMHPHRSYVAIFQDVYTSTGSIATALQALHTLVFQSSYYDFLPQFDDTDNAAVSFFEPALIPVQLKGLIIVWACVILHLFVVILVLILFLSRQSISIIGDYWQTFAQATNGEIGHLITMSSTSSDEEVEKYLKSELLDKETYVTKYDEASGMSSVIRKRNKAVT